MRLLTPIVRPRGVLAQMAAVSAAASVAGAAFALFQRWPLWAVVLAGIAPWLPILLFETAWARRHYGWLALYYLLVVTQGGHVVEHVVQVAQIHVFGLEGHQARGVFGALDIEWVHVGWNTWVLIAVVALLVRFRSNPWLWAALVLAAWHEAEHVYIMSIYLTTGTAGTPGLLAEGGRIGGGVGLSRPDLHLLYNLVETTPLVAGFAYQLRRTYDSWLARAFPKLDESLLREVTGRVSSHRVRAGQEVVREGDLARSVYVIARGEFEVVREPGRRLATLGPGRYFGEVGLLRAEPRMATVRARTSGDLLELDRDSFQRVLAASPDTARAVAEHLRGFSQG